LKEQATDLEVVPVECLSNCTRSCTAAVAAPGKWTYVVGHLDPEQNVEDMLQFARLHGASADGLTVWRDRPVHVRKNTIARVPPMPTPKEPA
jgi:predicted metal-binding protein